MTTISSLSIPSTDGIVLDAKFWKVKDYETSSNYTKPWIIFSHQLSKLGGSGDLMEGMASHMSQKGYDSVTFNYRGVGRSTGSSTWTFKNELNDLKSVIDYTINNYNATYIFLVGSSAGAPVAGAALDYSPKILGAMLIGYVWGFWSSILFGWAYGPLENSEKPKLFIVGDRDEFTSMSQYHARIKSLKGTINEMKLIKDKNHFQIEAPQYDRKNTDWLNEFIENYIISTDHSSNSKNEIELKCEKTSE